MQTLTNLCESDWTRDCLDRGCLPRNDLACDPKWSLRGWRVACYLLVTVVCCKYVQSVSNSKKMQYSHWWTLIFPICNPFVCNMNNIFHIIRELYGLKFCCGTLPLKYTVTAQTCTKDAFCVTQKSFQATVFKPHSQNNTVWTFFSTPGEVSLWRPLSTEVNTDKGSENEKKFTVYCKNRQM